MLWEHFSSQYIQRKVILSKANEEKKSVGLEHIKVLRILAAIAYQISLIE